MYAKECVITRCRRTTITNEAIASPRGHADGDDPKFKNSTGRRWGNYAGDGGPERL